MSLNVAVASPVYVIVAADRRLSSFAQGEIKTSRSTKLTLFRCADAHGAITYNGIGRDDAGSSPSEWVMDLDERYHFDEMKLDDILAHLAADAQTRTDAFLKKI